MSLRDEILARPDCEAFIATKDCQAISELISVGRTQYTQTFITERGVRAAVGISAASQFLRLLKECEEAEGVPSWLSTILSTIGVPADVHIDYADALASAYGWLRQGAGIDLSSATTRGMLDIIAASNPAKYGNTATVLKNLAKVPNPVTLREVGIALFNEDGTLK